MALSLVSAYTFARGNVTPEATPELPLLKLVASCDMAAVLPTSSAAATNVEVVFFRVMTVKPLWIASPG
jgi:hypothetical protein